MEGKRWNAALEGYLDELNSGKSLDPNLILQSFLKPTSYVSEFLRYGTPGGGYGRASSRLVSDS